MRNNFRNIGYYTVSKFDNIYSFFSFVGCMTVVFFKLLRKHKPIYWPAMIKTIYLSGVRLALPVMIISGLIGFSIAIALTNILSQFFSEDKALPIALELTINGLAPIVTGIILAVQSALNLINVKVQNLRHSREAIFLHHIMPITIGIFITGFMLFSYSIFSFLSSIYITFQFILGINIQENWHQLGSYVTFLAVLSSYFQMMMYCATVSLVVGYYYYTINLKKISLRQAVSRIITRSLIFIFIDSAGLNFINI